MKLIIIGGGITGLSASYYAHKKAPDARITVLESAGYWGGKIVTDRVRTSDLYGRPGAGTPFACTCAGASVPRTPAARRCETASPAPTDDLFIIEGGPDTFLATKPWGVTLCRELGLGERLQGTNPYTRNTYVLHRGRLKPLPDGLTMMVPARIQPMLATRLLSWPQKARMGLDFLLPPHPLDGDESLGSFISRRLGRAAYENLIEPLMSGIYAGDGDQLSLQATFPYLRDLERKHGSLARGAMKTASAAQSNGKAVQGSRSAFLTPATGLAEIIEALVTHLTQNDIDLRLNSPVKSVKSNSLTPDTWHVTLDNGATLEADAVILASPAHSSATLLASFNPALAAELAAIPYTQTATVSLAYYQSDLPRPLEGYGYVNPRREGRRALACTWTSTKFPHRAPEGYALLRIFVGRAGLEADIAWDEASLLELAREELQLTLGINAEPLLSRVFIWDKAMPQYNLGHPERLDRIHALVANHPGLALAGAGYRGIGIPDCIHSGELAVEKVITFAR
ncbi:MAG: protoporphyrinogen oxidase [Anaerolineae bacterium CG_4_8_14_3_um_filter_59_70]|nr:MAG: protoporphyrinogen oxidase [Anaerolineae bacterium CG_4_8_14_3_um_filter_59_70]